MSFWVQLGVAGFRIDAAPFVIEQIRPGTEDRQLDFEFLTELRTHVSWRQGDALLLAEANVAPDELVKYVADRGGSANRIHMLFDFLLNDRIVLALARRQAEPIVEARRNSPKLPPGAQWATFLRNHDEIDLSRLTADQRAEVFAAFDPEEIAQLYGRGIRRRLAPMLGGDRHRLELAYSLQFTLRGTPVLRYGEEIGVGDDLSLPGRDAIRTPMQWAPVPGGGFTRSDRPIRPLVSDRQFGYRTVNVAGQRHDPGSLLAWFERMIRTLRESPEVGAGTCLLVDEPTPPAVLAHRADGPSGSMLFLHNLGTAPERVDLGKLAQDADIPNQVLGNQEYTQVDGLRELDLDPYGYRWIRLSRNPAG